MTGRLERKRLPADRSRFRPVWIALGLGLGFPLVTYSAEPAKKITFTVSDELAVDQVDEEIAVSVNHMPVGTLKVGPGKASDSLTVTVPAAASYRYDLCGHLNQREGGKVVEHKIDSGGSFTDLDGQALAAFNENATLFYLVEPGSGGPMPAEGMDTGHSCTNTVSMIRAPGDSPRSGQAG